AAALGAGGRGEAGAIPSVFGHAEGRAAVVVIQVAVVTVLAQLDNAVAAAVADTGAVSVAKIGGRDDVAVVAGGASRSELTGGITAVAKIGRASCRGRV